MPLTLTAGSAENLKSGLITLLRDAGYLGKQSTFIGKTRQQHALTGRSAEVMKSIQLRSGMNTSQLH